MFVWPILEYIIFCFEVMSPKLAQISFWPRGWMDLFLWGKSQHHCDIMMHLVFLISSGWSKHPLGLKDELIRLVVKSKKCTIMRICSNLLLHLLILSSFSLFGCMIWFIVVLKHSSSAFSRSLKHFVRYLFRCSCFPPP